MNTTNFTEQSSLEKRLPALEYWRHTKYSTKALDEIFEGSPIAWRFIRIRRYGASEPSFDWLPGLDTGGLAEIARLFRAVFDKHKDLQGTLLLTLHDGVDISSFKGSYYHQVPVLVFSKRYDDHLTIPVPDPLIAGNLGLTSFRNSVKGLTKKYPWEVRSNAVFWRGRTTGMPLTEENWRTNQRIRLCKISRDVADDTFLDAYLSEVVQCESQAIRDEIAKEGLLRSYVPMPEMYGYRYLIDVDGNFAAWSYGYKLAMNCVVFKIQSPFCQWFSPDLVPWKHYIPVSSSMKELVSLIEWTRTHDAVCKQIAQNAFDLMANWEEEQIIDYVGSLFRYIFKNCCRSSD